jgi:hypothetical protein
MQKTKLVTFHEAWEVYVTKTDPNDTVSNFIEKIESSKVKLKKLDNIYVYPKSMVTRDIVNEVKSKYKVSQVRKIETADKFVLSSKYIRNLMFELSYRSNKVNRHDFLTAADLVIDQWDATQSNWYTASKETIINWRNAVLNFTSHADTEIIVGDNICFGVSSHLDDSDEYEAALKESLETSSRQKCRTGVRAEGYKILQSLFQKRNKVFSEKQFSDLVTSSNPADLEAFNSICSMFDSSKADKELAVTLMSSYSWDKSIDLLGIIWKKYGDSIRECKAYKSSAFKIIKKTVSDMAVYSWGSLTTYLDQEHYITPQALEIIVNEHVKDLNRSYMVTQGNVFTIQPQAIKLTDKLDEIRSQL